MLKKCVVGLGLASLISACATTDAPKDLGKLEYTGFTEKSDGSVYQSVMGLSCLSEIDGIPRTSTKVYNDGGTDVSCNYSEADPDRIFTVYLSRFSGDTLGNYYAGSKSAVESVISPKGFTHDKELSDKCSSKSLDTASILSGFSGILSGENTSNEITLTTSPSSLYINPEEGKMSVLVVDEMFEKDFFKTRYTGPYSSAEDVDQVCEAIRANYLEMKSIVGENRGLEKSESDNLMDLINSSDGDS